MSAGLLVVLLGGMLPLVAQARAASAGARVHLRASLLAGQRLAEIAVLTHLRLPTGAIVRDEATRLGSGPVFAAGGPGLREGGAGALDVPEPTASDWLDDHGQWEGAGAAPGVSARYLRQWSLVAGDEGCVQVWVRVSVRAPADNAFAGGLQCPWGAEEP